MIGNTRRLLQKYPTMRKAVTYFSSSSKTGKVEGPVLNEFLLDILACPITKAELYYDSELHAFVSIEGKVAFRVADNYQINLLPRGPLLASIAEEE